MTQFRVAQAFAFALAAALCGCGGGGSGGSDGAIVSPPPPPAGPGDPAIFELGGVPAGYALVWSDEFSTDGLPNPAKWDYDIDRNALGWYNDEDQYYSNARLENSRVEGGRLVIEARREDLDPVLFADWGGQHYTSARLVTRDRASWRYGFFEIRAKLPCGRGSWPAIWMLSQPPSLTWPDGGEIDIMEHVGHTEGTIYATVHTRDYNHAAGTSRSAQTMAADICNTFHNFQLTWTPTRIAIGMDDRNFYQYSNDGSGIGEWPFDRGQYLLLNIAIGGTWGGEMGIDDTIFPIRMEVDHVRIYQAP